jgi:hypothetical protein
MLGSSAAVLPMVIEEGCGEGSSECAALQTGLNYVHSVRAHMSFFAATSSKSSTNSSFIDRISYYRRSTHYEELFYSDPHPSAVPLRTILESRGAML